MESIEKTRFPLIKIRLLLKKFWYVIFGGLVLSVLAFLGYSRYIDKPFYSVTGALCNSQVISNYSNYNEMVSVIKSDEYLDSVSSDLKENSFFHNDGSVITGGELKKYITFEEFTVRTRSVYLYTTFTWKENNTFTVQILNEYLKLSSAEINEKLKKNDSTGWIEIKEKDNIYSTQVDVTSSSRFRTGFMFVGFGLVFSVSLAIGLYLRRYSQQSLLKEEGTSDNFLYFSLK